MMDVLSQKLPTAQCAFAGNVPNQVVSDRRNHTQDPTRISASQLFPPDFHSVMVIFKEKIKALVENILLQMM